MQTPQAWIFIGIVFSRETFPLFKCCIIEPGRTQVLIEKYIPVIDDAPRCSERGHFQIPLSVWLQMRVELEGKYVFWISERAVFSVRACLLHSCAITVRLLVASGKAAQTGQDRKIGSVNVQALFSIYRSNFLPLRRLSCRWHVIPHMVHFSLAWNPCQRR